MDGVDIAIIRAMGTRAYEPRPKPLDALQPASIARTTGLALNTVKERIARMTDSGVIAGYHAVPNLRHLRLGAEATYISFPTEEAKEAALPRLRSMDGMLELNDFLGRGLCADFAFCDEADRRAKLSLFEEIAGGHETKRFYSWQMPSIERPLSPLDWRIVHALRADPRAGASEIADVVGVSARTVKRHLSRMAAEGSVFLAPKLDPSKAEGLFIFAILAFLEEGSGPRPMAQLRSEFRDEHIHALVPASQEFGHFDMILFARTSAQMEAMRRRAEAVPGVSRAEAWLYRGVEGVGPWLDGAIPRPAAARAT